MRPDGCLPCSNTSPTGACTLTGARPPAPHLTDENADALLSAARHKSKREIEELIAALKPLAGRRANGPPTCDYQESPSSAETPARMLVAAPSVSIPSDSESGATMPQWLVRP